MSADIFCGVDVADGLLSVAVMRCRPDGAAEVLHCEQLDLARPSQALTDDEIEAALGHEPLDYGQGFFAGVRWAEQQHRITE